MAGWPTTTSGSRSRPAPATAPRSRCMSGRTSGWATGGGAKTALNYRRFFDIPTLAAVRVEDLEVFDATHALILRWVREGQVTGLRVDHPDGRPAPGLCLRRRASAAPSAWRVVEKILGPDEAMPPPS